MKVVLGDGKYVLAVSGGVDSMVLLDLLSILPGVELIVAHFNHGIRQDSYKDEELVESAAARYGFPFEAARGQLGKSASEAAARAARYRFLEKVLRRHNAAAIVTAHHQDDLIETAMLNLVRGTGRRGLVALAVNPKVLRPLLGYGKRDILKYAKKRQLKWREDTTNSEDAYSRNYFRHKVAPNLTASQRQTLLSNIDKVAKIDRSINYKIAKLSHKVVTDNTINRRAFTALPVSLGNELVLYWLRQQQTRQPDKKTINRLNIGLRASKGNKVQPVSDGLMLIIDKKTAHFSHTL